MWDKPASRVTLDDAMETYYQELCLVARRHGHAQPVANDIVHDLYVRLTGKPKVLEGRASIRTFLMRACINLGIDRFRRERLERRLFSGTELEAMSVAADIPDAEALADRQYRLGLLHKAILEMSVERRRVFLASCIANLTSDEIAARSGISRNMVDRHLRKAYLHSLSRLEDTL
jgi:RNA polymerase sigma-70 factor (ECF subfamily)